MAAVDVITKGRTFDGFGGDGGDGDIGVVEVGGGSGHAATQAEVGAHSGFGGVVDYF